MNTWVLIVMVSFGYDYSKPVSGISTVVPGFTTQQACENAKNEIKSKFAPNRGGSYVVD